MQHGDISISVNETVDRTVSALTVAGFDPSGGAGVIADSRAMASLGVFPLSVVTAITFQSTAGVAAYEPLDEETVERQLDTLLLDMEPSAVKTGMLPTPAHVEAVANRADALNSLVIDPVARSSSGVLLTSEGAMAALVKELIPLCVLVTPNLREAEQIGGIAIDGRDSAQESARAIHALGADSVCITGGHWSRGSQDLFYDGGDFIWLGAPGDRIDLELHGTGCCFSALATACIALGMDTATAVETAGRNTLDAIRNAVAPGSGMAVPWPQAT